MHLTVTSTQSPACQSTSSDLSSLFRVLWVAVSSPQSPMGCKYVFAGLTQPLSHAVITASPFFLLAFSITKLHC
ncbi:hypothetical protein HETIRDRAFT_170638 [Heterobasidion irregulare TC 32-1]|uniref:Uncharacterized protein n=1 Tax=Heterobasidion irregulare (strain TC 32-1) TaxID=747525 RepID=W4KE68_HETIT|nr:uncharacterized protein HETIRDRAFT_170638 [Heterobasidion irregulare TC 32-1]ETW84152.1 hypothetical protein HETIRDRAFT_170638 [Heterobasidion irregulare TC 32-1]